MILTDAYADHYGERDLTAPIVAVTLAEQVAAVARFGLDADNALDEWQLVIDPDLDGMVIRWAYLRVTVGERSALDLARYVVRQRADARRYVDRAAMRARADLGWGKGEPLVRCVVCRTADTASRQHAPGSRDCRDTQAERARAHGR